MLLLLLRLLFSPFLWIPKEMATCLRPTEPRHVCRVRTDLECNPFRLIGDFYKTSQKSMLRLNIHWNRPPGFVNVRSPPADPFRYTSMIFVFPSQSFVAVTDFFRKSILTAFQVKQITFLFPSFFFGFFFKGENSFMIDYFYQVHFQVDQWSMIIAQSFVVDWA